uniref:Uncharacterized protein n=1 Tax=Romanomermis culicivorax TaxID=13658 RepID=A0A915I0P8_ROMCU
MSLTTNCNSCTAAMASNSKLFKLDSVGLTKLLLAPRGDAPDTANHDTQVQGRIKELKSSVVQRSHNLSKKNSIFRQEPRNSNPGSYQGAIIREPRDSNPRSHQRVVILVEKSNFAQENRETQVQGRTKECKLTGGVIKP